MTFDLMKCLNEHGRKCRTNKGDDAEIAQVDFEAAKIFVRIAAKPFLYWFDFHGNGCGRASESPPLRLQNLPERKTVVQGYVYYTYYTPNGGVLVDCFNPQFKAEWIIEDDRIVDVRGWKK